MNLKPCPFCGERLVLHGDHHGEWWAHRDETGACFASTSPIFDEKDAAEWNTRADAGLVVAAASAFNFLINHQRSFGIEDGSDEEFKSTKLLRSALPEDVLHRILHSDAP